MTMYSETHVNFIWISCDTVLPVQRIEIIDVNKHTRETKENNKVCTKSRALEFMVNIFQIQGSH